MRAHHGFKVGMKEFGHWLKRLFYQPLFFFVTICGHTSIFSGALLFRYFEKDINPHAHSLFDAYYWAIATATTVGTVDIAPVSMGGKIVAIGMMVTSSLFLWSYAALFAASVVLPSVREIERDVRVDAEAVQNLMKQLERLNSEREGRK